MIKIINEEKELNELFGKKKDSNEVDKGSIKKLQQVYFECYNLWDKLTYGIKHLKAEVRSSQYDDTIEMFERNLDKFNNKWKEVTKQNKIYPDFLLKFPKDDKEEFDKFYNDVNDLKYTLLDIENSIKDKKLDMLAFQGYKKK